MYEKLSIDELIVLETKHNLWKHKLFNYPLWIHCREPLLDTGIMATRKVHRPKIMKMLKSFFQTIKFLVTQKKYENVYFLMERAELLEIYNQDRNTKKLLFLNPEQDRVYEGNDYISSDFFSLLRFLSRKVAFLIFKKQYNETIEHLKQIDCHPKLHKYIKIALGDALFLKFLSLILSKKSKKFYTGAVIPMGEKFVNALNSYEVQHGVIYPEHIGYIGLPEVKNSLILYSKHYKKIMQDHGYKGKLIIMDYKKTFFEREVKRNFPIVIYTQPTQKMQEGINSFFKKYLPNNFFIQKHPKDYFSYEIDKHFFVNATTPFEVQYPIMYSSSIIENFTLYNKRCYIYDIKYSDVDLKDFLTIYTMESESEIIIMDSLDEIYKKIMKEIECVK